MRKSAYSCTACFSIFFRSIHPQSFVIPTNNFIYSIVIDIIDQVPPDQRVAGNLVKIDGIPCADGIYVAAERAGLNRDRPASGVDQLHRISVAHVAGPNLHI